MPPDPAADDWRPAAGKTARNARAGLLARIRMFFAERSVLEVETPILSAAGNSDPGITQWRTRNPETWLRSSPEFAMKRLLAAGSGDIFELGRVFRAGESGRRHNPEFTLLEWYRVGWTYLRLADEVIDLLRFCWPRPPLPLQHFTYRELFGEFAGADPFSDSPTELGARLRGAGIALERASRAECLDLLLAEVIQPRLPEATLTVVRDFPEEQAALARVRTGDPPVAERFEVFLGPVELANGYQELTDAAEQRRRFEREIRRRIAAGATPIPLDERFLAALATGLPECAGVALGVDRLLMALLGMDHIQEVLNFPFEQA